MKKYAKRLTALALALALVLGMTGQTAFASWALGTELVDRTVELAEGVFWTERSLWSASKSDLRTENYITYTPGSGVTPMVYSGTYVTSRNTASAAASALEAQGYRVIAGVNGGFFNSDGTIVGMLMTEGVVRALDVHDHALLGFTWDGHIFIDESRVTKTVSWEAQNGAKQYRLSGFNAYRNSDDLGGLYLYNKDFSTKVNYDTGRGCVAVILTPVAADGDAGDDVEPVEPGGGEQGDGLEAVEPGDGETEDGLEPVEPGDGEQGDGLEPVGPDDGEQGDGLEPVEPGDGEPGDGPEPDEPGDGEQGDDPEMDEPDDGEQGNDPEPDEPDDGEQGDDPEPPEPKGVTMNGTLTLTVEAVLDTRAGDAFNGVLTDGRYMLYANYYNGNDGLLNALRALTPGQQVTVTVSGVSEQWADAAYGITGLYTLLRDGEIVSGLPTPSNPYTAVGLKADGTAVFYTIDGRQSGYSVGATYAQVAQRLQELGCVTAVALDGGGSTTLGATLPGEQKFGLLNRPSQANRALNNFIFLVDGEAYAGMNPGFYLSSDTQVVLAGASLGVHAVKYGPYGEKLTVTPPDESETPPDELDTPPDESDALPDESGTLPVEPEAMPNWAATGGTIEGDGQTAVYTAGNTAGTYAVSAGSGSELPVRVVNELSRLTVTLENGAPVSSLSLQSLYTVDLTANGKWNNLDVAMGDENVSWSVSGGIGTIDAQGRFTAGWHDASGEITASAGGKTVTISVTVQANYPFSDIGNHWSTDYVLRLYELGLTQGVAQPDGTYAYHPSGKLSRGELLTFITRLLHVDTDEFQDVTLPFVDADTIPEWMLPSVRAMYALGVLAGSGSDGALYANVSNGVSREEAMTMLGRVLAEQVSWDLSGFADSDSVSKWALSYVETLVGLNVVHGSGGMLTPKSNITRGEVAKLLVEIYGLEKADLTPRPTEPGDDEPGSEEPDDPGDTPDDPEQPGEGTGDSDSPADPDDAPDGSDRQPNQSGEGTGGSDSPVDPDGTPDGSDRQPEQPGEGTDHLEFAENM